MIIIIIIISQYRVLLLIFQEKQCRAIDKIR